MTRAITPERKLLPLNPFQKSDTLLSCPKKKAAEINQRRRWYTVAVRACIGPIVPGTYLTTCHLTHCSSAAMFLSHSRLNPNIGFPCVMGSAEEIKKRYVRLLLFIFLHPDLLVTDSAEDINLPVSCSSNGSCIQSMEAARRRTLGCTTVSLMCVQQLCSRMNRGKVCILYIDM